ncbi:MAG: hypothetical protein COV34_00875 [Candidatus Zambryskibacteria bacterium CG10_big_fil_rev_8_21_14_0_10_42_12]|uniref:HIT domain-containing protein n=1 Tax=Candidatus Zambryskibacteria bacterium CG10_big_fil_rev_8_21_14_0_10_42_12 TaxID=1975115 RepID=A0A2H0QXT1_9BACT|nr:MAG: hypothetical protein COV34_00875 [Candidatus Zambryskibacteria bacterium CG10_big_fil_rev_8_21_14_0_10_42_12]
MNFKFRSPEQDKVYQTYKATNPMEAMLANWEDRIVEEFTHWVIIKNKFPWDKFAKTHHLLVPKRRFAKADDMNVEEEKELKEIRKKIRTTYDMFIENLTGTLNHIYHPHLIIFKEETDPIYYEIEKEIENLHTKHRTTDAQYPASV